MDGSNKQSNSPRGTFRPVVVRPPEQIRREGNHLRYENSVYLRQHAYNPVEWYPWGKAALSRAFLEDKPIFLSVGYSSCHWCHVMERDVFEDDTVAEFLNRHFISIKVDREEHPELDKTYMDAVLALNGNAGWPMSVFLTPEQKPFFGGTFFPRDQFLVLLTRVEKVFAERRQEIESQARKLSETISRELQPIPGEIRPEILHNACAQARQNFDEVWGGTRTHIKFPMPVSWSFLLHRYRKSGDPELSGMITRTLDRLGSGGIQDHVSGGFHRYATEPTWLVPHFEKMLTDNAQLASLYLEAWTVFDNARYRDIARNTLDFLLSEMRSEEGGFYSSFDADSDGEEGAFYLWSPEEIIEAVGPKDGPPLASLLGVEPGGNFQGKSILTRRKLPQEVALEFKREKSEIDALFERYRNSLWVARSRRVAPGLDKKIVTSSNGLAISAFSRAYRLLGEERYRIAAEQASDFLMKRHRRKGGKLIRSSTGGVWGPEAILDDYAFLAVGLLDLYQATGELWQLKRALKIIDLVNHHFRHPVAGFYLTTEEHPSPLGRPVVLTDGVQPSGNSAMLSALLTSAHLTGNATLAGQVESDLNSHAGMMQMVGMEMAGWLDVLQRHLGPAVQAVVAGDAEARGTRRLLMEYNRINPVNAVLVQLPGEGPSPGTMKLMPAWAGKRAVEGNPTAYVCSPDSCQKPTPDPVEFGRQLMQGWVK